MGNELSHSYSYNVNEVTPEEQVSDVNHIILSGMGWGLCQIITSCAFCCELVTLTALITSAWLVQYVIYPGQIIYAQKDNGETN